MRTFKSNRVIKSGLVNNALCKGDISAYGKHRGYWVPALLYGHLTMRNEMNRKTIFTGILLLSLVLNAQIFAIDKIHLKSNPDAAAGKYPYFP